MKRTGFRRAGFANELVIEKTAQTHRMPAWVVLGSASDGPNILRTYPVVFGRVSFSISR